MCDCPITKKCPSNEFWKKYNNLDFFQRREALWTTSDCKIFKSIKKENIEQDIFEFMLISAIQNLIDDAINYKNKEINMLKDIKED